MMSREKPNASDTASSLDSLGAIKMAVPGPPSMSTAVPSASAPKIRGLIFTEIPPVCAAEMTAPLPSPSSTKTLGRFATLNK